MESPIFSNLKELIKMKKLFIALSTLFVFGLNAQVTTIPAEITSPDDSLTIIVDVSLTECTSLVGDPGPMYLWTWEPSEPVGGNGQWTASNIDMEMTNVGPNQWSITFLPTDFYVDVSMLFETGISFLVKKSDGGGGGDCNSGEFKTEDLNITAVIPEVPVTKLATFPTAISGDSLIRIDEKDIFTLIYDNKLEEKVPMQGVSDLYVYASAEIEDMNGMTTTTEVTPLLQVGSNPALAMTDDGNKEFSFSIWPQRFFSAASGSVVKSMSFRVLRQNVTNSDDVVEGTFTYRIGCE